MAQCLCADGVLVDVDLAVLDSRLLRSVAEAAPGEIIPLPGVASGCLEALLRLLCCGCWTLGPIATAATTATAVDGIDLIRAAIELDCGMPVHVDKVRRHVAASLGPPLVDMDPHHETHDELRRWFDVFACAPPLYFVYVLTYDGRIRDRLRNLLSACRSPSREVVESAVDFFRRMGRRPSSDPEGASAMDHIASALVASDAVLGMEVHVAKCLVEHVRPVVERHPRHRLNFWEALCESCISKSRPEDAMAIADMCPPEMRFNDLVRSIVHTDLIVSHPTAASREFVEHIYATKDDGATRDAVWHAALNSPSRSVVEWAMAFTGRRITVSSMKRCMLRFNDGNVRMLFDVALHDDRCADDEVADLLLAFKALLSVRALELDRVARMLLRGDGDLTSALLVAVATRTKPNAEVIGHLAASPGLRRLSDGWFEAVAYFAKRRDLPAVERLLLLQTE